jgi:hypothetical protein
MSDVPPILYSGVPNSYFHSGLVQVGAVIILLSITVGPFTQQIVQYGQYIEYAQDTGTTTRQAWRYSKGNEFVNLAWPANGTFQENR